MKKQQSPPVTMADRLVRYFSPQSYAKRVESRIKSDLMLRQYDAAQNFGQSPIKRNSRSASSEVTNAVAPIRNNVRELMRNAPFAKKGLDVIVNGVVGYGISASISHPVKAKEEQIKTLWKEWSNGLCSIDGKSDFYMLQNRVMSAVASDGEVLVKKLVTDGSVRLQLLESDYLAFSLGKSKSLTLKEGETLINGIVHDHLGRPTGYILYERHPGDGSLKLNTELTPADRVMHVYRQDRPEQNRGVSWFAPVVQSLNMLAELQWTQLVRMKLGASITAVVTSEQSTLPPEFLAAQRQDDWALEPGTIRYINPGEKIEFPSIPNPEGFEGSTKLALREIAAGLGVTYEALSGDLSQVNFSSGRMGDLQFRANVDQWRWHMLIPMFCNPAFEAFKTFCQLKGVDTAGLSVDWVPPARQMINPTEEVSSTSSAIRSGLQTLPNALRELGYDPESHLREVARSNQLLDELGLIFDSDPRRTANQQLQSPDSLQGMKSDQSNK